MKRIGVLFVAIIMAFSSGISAQPHEFWQPIDTGFNAGLSGDLAYSENFGMCISSAGSSDTTDTGEVFSFMAGFDGNQWHAITYEIGYGIQTFVDFEDGMLVGGLAASLNGQNMPHMAYFDGQEWSFPYTFNGHIAKLKWVNDTLYALGWFTEIDGQEAYRVAALVDGVWQGMLSADIAEYIPGWQITDIDHLNGDVYLSGNFWVSPNQQSNNLDGPIIGFGRLENGWITRPTEELYFLGTTAIRSLVAYQNKLYLGGGTVFAGAGAGHAIHSFDGTYLNPVPYPPRMWYDEFQLMTVGGVVKMVVNGAYLYAGGEFNHMGEDTFTGKVARWDGNQWCGLFATGFEDIFRNMAFVNDQMIIVNPFVYEFVYPFPADSFWLYTGGDAVSNCTEPLSAGQEAPADMLTLHPNPAHTHATLTSAQHPLERLALCDLQGRVVHEARPAAPTYRIPLTGLPAGMYVVSVQVGGEVVRMKLVVDGAR